MPILSIAVPELESHLYYNVIKQCIHKVCYDLGLENIIKNNIYIETGFSSPKNFTDGKHNATLNTNKIKAQAEININPSNLKWDNISFAHALEPIGFSHTNKDRDFEVVFYDPDNNIKLSEMHLPTYISINCTISLLDRNLAYQIPSMIYRHYPPNMPSMEHISYDYPIPKPTIALLYTLYKLKRFNKPDTFRKYLDMSTGHNCQFAINRVATKEELVMKKILIDSLFMLDYNDSKPNEVTNNRSVNFYDINFTLHIQFTRPDTILMDYPIVLDNQLLPGNLIPTTLHRSEPISNLIGPYPANIINEAVDHYQKKYTEPVMIRFPDYDEWNVPINSSIIKMKYRPWFSCVFTMDEDTEYTVLPLGGILDEELGYELHPVVKSILKKQGNESFNTDVLFNITIFNDNIPVETSYLDLDEDLNLTVRCINPRKVRRLVISELQDYNKLHPNHKEMVDIYKDELKEFIVQERNKNNSDSTITKEDIVLQDLPLDRTKNAEVLTNQYKKIHSINSDLITKRS